MQVNSNADALFRIPLNVHETEPIATNPGDINQEIEQLLNEIYNRPDVYELIETDLNKILLKTYQNNTKL